MCAHVRAACVLRVRCMFLTLPPPPPRHSKHVRHRPRSGTAFEAIKSFLRYNGDEVAEGGYRCKVWGSWLRNRWGKKLLLLGTEQWQGARREVCSHRRRSPSMVLRARTNCRCGCLSGGDRIAVDKFQAAETLVEALCGSQGIIS
jgi:hypothetical protein